MTWMVVVVTFGLHNIGLDKNKGEEEHRKKSLVEETMLKKSKIEVISKIYIEFIIGYNRFVVPVQ